MPTQAPWSMDPVQTRTVVITTYTSSSDSFPRVGYIWINFKVRGFGKRCSGFHHSLGKPMMGGGAQLSHGRVPKTGFVPVWFCCVKTAQAALLFTLKSLRQVPKGRFRGFLFYSESRGGW